MAQSSILFFFFLLLIHKTSSGSSAKLRIHQNGINYATQVAKEVLENELKGLKIPEQRVTFKGGHARFFNIDMRSIDLPTTTVAFRGEDLLVTTGGGSVYGRFRFQAKRRIAFIKATTSGNAEIWLDNVNTKVLLRWKKGTDKPQLEVAGCTGKLESFRIRFHGNIVVAIVNMFKGKIGRTMRDTVSEKICPEFTKLVNEKINKALADLPSLFPVTKEGKRIFSIQYENVTTVVGKDFLDVSANAAFIFNQKKCIAVIKKEYPDGPATNMLSAWGSQGIPDCLLQAFHESNQIQYVVDSKNAKIAPYLRTTCPKTENFLPQCIGALFPKLATDYPNRAVSLFVSSTAPPNVTVDLQGIRIHGYSSLRIMLDQKYLATFDLNGTAVVVPKLNGTRFFGGVKVESCHIRMVSSAIGEIDAKILEIAGPALAVGASYILQPIVEKGIIIPSYLGVQVAGSSSISLLDGYLRTDVDIVKTAAKSAPLTRIQRITSTRGNPLMDY